MAAYLKFDGVDGHANHSGGVNALMGDGSVRFAREGADNFDFTAAPPQEDALIAILIGLLLPAVQKAHDDDRGAFNPDDYSDPRMDGDDDVVVDGRIITAEDWGYTAPPPEPSTLFLPAVQSAREAAKRMQCAVTPQDASDDVSSSGLVGVAEFWDV